MIPFHLYFDLKTIQLYLRDAVLGIGHKIELSLQFSVTRMYANNIHLIMLQLLISLLPMSHIFAVYNPKLE